jgi:predicted amidohydrolase YtcJ
MDVTVREEDRADSDRERGPMKIYKGKILSCDENNRQWLYLIEKKGRIHYVGDDLPREYAGKKQIDLGDRVLLPSFGDGHIHFSNWALLAVSQFDVREASCIGDVQDIVSAHVQKCGKQPVVLGFGFSRHSVREHRVITRRELDQACGDIPLMLIGYGGHSSICNSAFIERLPTDCAGLRGFNDESGQMLNEAYFRCTDFATSLIPRLTFIRSILRGFDLLAAKGIGMIHAVEGIGFPGDCDVTLVAMAARAMARRKGFQTRLFFQTMDIGKVKKRKLPRVGGCFATALDGCFGACDAALLEPYTHDSSNRGILFQTEEEVHRFVMEAHREGLQIELHALGDAAVRRAVDAFETALAAFPRRDHRHTLIHASLIHPEDLDRIERLGLGITLQPSFLAGPLEPVGYLKGILGERIKGGSPLKELLNRDILLSAGSDAPVTAPDPLAGLAACINHPYDRRQNLTVAEALSLYTRRLYRTTFDDRERGTLEVGKWADMVVLSGNPLKCATPEAIRALRVESLLLKGRTYRPGMSMLALLFWGLVGRRVKI